MIFATTFVLASALVASAANINVTVGDQNGLAFNPTSVNAQLNDTVNFQFMSKNHSVTQSTFAAPCTPMANGVDSGFQAVTPGSSTIPSWTITVNDPSKPLWFHCAQIKPVNHCQMGMVFAINATPDKTFAAFQAAAKSSANGTTTPPAVSGAAPSAAAGTGSSPGGANSGATATSSSAASGSTSTPNGANASRGLSSAGAVSAVSLIAAFVGFML